MALTKPRIIVLLLVTALGGMFLAARGAPDPLTLAVVLLSGTLAAGGANAINHSLDRDIDHVMRRTRGRPVAGGRIVARDALWFGVGLNVAAFALLSVLVNPLSAGLTLAATIVYVFVYTLGLKRTTPQNIVIGGAAGAFPPMVGWAAVQGDVGVAALYMFAIVFFWTPPHFWALALLIKDDYEGGLPVLAGLPGPPVRRHHDRRFGAGIVGVPGAVRGVGPWPTNGCGQASIDIVKSLTIAVGSDRFS